MKRALPNLLALLSLLVCAATGTLWWWSLSSAGVRAYAFGNDGGKACVAFDAGGVAVAYRREAQPATAAASAVYWDWPAATRDGGPLAHLGFTSGTVNAGRQVSILSGVAVLGRLFQTPAPAAYVKIPWWSLLLAAAVAPTSRLLSAARRRRRARRCLCPFCGYDLRATPGRCPECGTPAACRPCVASPQHPPQPEERKTCADPAPKPRSHTSRCPFPAD